MGDVDWAQVAILVAVLVPSVILHEVSHGWVANHLGDDTAKHAGRLTLNPLKHVDPFGTVILPLMLSLVGGGAFGYAKPVPVNPGRLRNPRQHSLYVSLAGPATNVTLALLSALLLQGRTTGELNAAIDGYGPLGTRVLLYFGLINVILAAFNLLPIPPLDGSALVERVLPASWWPTWLKFRQWGFGVLLLLIFVVPGSLDRVFDPALEQWAKLL